MLSEKLERLLHSILPGEGNESCTNCGKVLPKEEFFWVWARGKTPRSVQIIREAIADGTAAQDTDGTWCLRMNFCPTCWSGKTGDYYRTNHPESRVESPST